MINLVIYNREQSKLKGQLITADSPDVRSWRAGPNLFSRLHHIGGVDISFVKGTNKACAMLVILTFPDLKVRRNVSIIIIIII